MDQNPKQILVEKIKSANSVLVTVSTNPSVDQLSAALGLALMLNALNVKSTAVFSGEVPNGLEFLDPQKTFNKDLNALRDFIISIDKEKADKLRYKVEDDVVKIYITPYKTTLSEADLNFEQGDLNVDLVLALGVHNKNDLDQAIVAHGQILHDATIASITAGGDTQSELGSINWYDPSASSLCEMLVSVSEALQSGILDKSMSTAFLTGIVAATERFSNDKTSPKVMTMSAQLMAAGADQQLIARNLRMDRGRTTELNTDSDNKPQQNQENVLELHNDRNPTTPEPETLEELEHEFDDEKLVAEQPQQYERNSGRIKEVKPLNSVSDAKQDQSLGGTFNATSQAAHDAVDEEKRRGINQEILTHGGQSRAPTLQPAQEPAIEIRAEDQVIDMPPQTDAVEEARQAVEGALQNQQPNTGQQFTQPQTPQTEIEQKIDHQIDIDPEGKINIVGDQPQEVLQNPLEQQVQAAQTPNFNLPKPNQPPAPQAEPTLPLPSIEQEHRTMIQEPPSEQAGGAELPFGVTVDDAPNANATDNTFLVSSPSPENAIPSSPPPLPPNPNQPPEQPENPLFTQQ